MKQLIEVLQTADREEIVVTEADWDRWWQELTGGDDSLAALQAKITVMDAFQAVVGTANNTGELYFKTKGWKIVVGNNLVKTALISPLLCGILAYTGISGGLTAAVIPTILPMLLDIQRVELSQKEEEIWLKLPLRQSKDTYKTASAWYHSLPKSIREQVHELDFKDFLEKLIHGGLATEVKKGEYMIYQPGKHKFKITFT
jgi:hypothetical protein